ncbi:HET-domain-containing protein [Patellaria atrata CBS 101060]|uniref:HET-domain-containing protein n=1 Tax=Patellaria atrata CBS 101060 TaxID=1346257 RepID=A0A9P4S1V2_9PEZI|nr:HET-domain-containing protein [Patellaria atrata CBS 101060]
MGDGYDAVRCYQPGPLPTRVIDVGASKGPDEIRVIQTDGTQSERYTTLSHCWGTAYSLSPPKLLRSNATEWYNFSDAQRLPSTYKDAITLTRLLGVRYLWIDSLCIIQDDEDDWRRESSKMASIYRNSYLTIAATAAEHSGIGCFSRASASSHVTRTRTKYEVMRQESKETYIRLPPNEITSLLSSPLYKRAWTLQEICLSKRRVHFADDQMYWQCQTRTCSEDGLLSAPTSSVTPSLLDSLVGTPNSMRTWWSWVEDYSNRKLTVQSDRLVAFAGITKYFEEQTGNTAVVGLWEDEIVSNLLWYTQNPAAFSPRGIPSWSWFNIDGQVTRPTFRDPRYWNCKRIQNLKVIRIEVKWAGERLVSDLTRSNILVTGQIATFIHVDASDDHTLRWEQKDWIFRIIRSLAPEGPQVDWCKAYCCFDLGSDSFRFFHGRICCLRVETLASYDHERNVPGNIYEVLIVEQLGVLNGDEFPSYRRMGVGSIELGFTPESVGKLDEFERQIFKEPAMELYLV